VYGRLYNRDPNTSAGKESEDNNETTKSNKINVRKEKEKN
jgi:hypothetical protein